MKKTIIIDAETTGLDAKQDEILQLTILTDRGKILFNEYIRPTHHTEWTEAEKIHHISFEMVKDSAPLAFHKKAIQKILDASNVIVGYNHSFDMSFLEAAGIHSDPKKNYDLMLEFSQLRGEWDEAHNCYKWYKLKECADYFGYDWGDGATHDSLSDARAVLFCYSKILAGETNKGGLKAKQQHPSAFRSSPSSRNKWFSKFILALTVLAALVLMATFLVPRITRVPAKRQRTIITTSALQKVLDISDLSTVEFRYGSVTQALDDKGNTKYYVTYNGTVQVGVDFSEIAKSIEIDYKSKIITITIPEPKVLSTNVNVDTLDYIFVKDKYNTTGITDEALRLCKEDLTNELNNTTDIYDIAKENAKSAISQLLEPWLNQTDDGYTIVVK